MAHQIAPPSTDGPLTAADAAIIRAEKALDNNTRDRLTQLYGESRAAQGKHIVFVRSTRKAWRCPSCGQTSLDIRRVCGHCLALEPGVGVSGRAQVATAAGKQAAALQPGRTHEPHVALHTIQHTKRTYRRVTDPVGDADTKGSSKSTQQAGESAALLSAGSEAESGTNAYGDEPDCEEDSTLCRRNGGAEQTADEQERDEGNVRDLLFPAPNPENRSKNLPPERVLPFTHFVALPIGTLPTVSESAQALVTALRRYAEGVAVSESAARKGKSSQSGAAHDDNDDEEEDGGDDGGEAEAEDSQPSAPSHSGGAFTNIGPDIVSPATKLHFTLLLLSLPSPKDVDFAKELLHIFADRWAAEGKKKLAALPGPSAAAPPASGIELRVGGLHVMPERVRGRRGGNTGDNAGAVRDGRVRPKSAAVVYVGLQDERSTKTVQLLQNLLHECFAELIPEETREEVERSKVNLHMTVMNKKWRRKGAKRPFDATGVLEKFGSRTITGADTSGDSVLIPRIDLNRMSRSNGKSDAYFVEDSVPI